MSETIKEIWRKWWWGFASDTVAKEIGRSITLGDLTSQDWEASQRKEICDYLASGHLVFSAISYSVKCPFCEAALNTSTIVSDGEWVWPRRLAHLVECHNFFIPDAMLASIREKAFKMPPKESADLSMVDWPTKPQPLTEEQRRTMEAVLYEEEGR